MRAPWSKAELAELAAIKPRDRGAIGRHAKRWGRKRHAVSEKLGVLRRRGLAPDVSHGRRAPPG
jgi:hypothetical protein